LDGRCGLARRAIGADRHDWAGHRGDFASFHILAAVVGILLWQWQRHRLPKLRRVLLEAATLYFMGAVLLGMFLSYLLVSIV
jgi:hypothetical protein